MQAFHGVSLSGFYCAVATGAYIRFGGHYIQHRSQDLSDALMQAIENAGAQAFKALVKDWGA